MPSHDLDELVAEIRAMLDSDDAASNISEPPSSVHEAAIDAVVAEIRAALQGDESDMMSDDESVIEPVDPPMTLKSKRAAKAFAAQAPLRAMEREIQSTDAFLGEDPLGRTNTALVSECRTKFKAWSQAQRSLTPHRHMGSQLNTAADCRAGNAQAQKFLHEEAIPYSSLDSRLWLMRMYLTWGIPLREVVNPAGGMTGCQRLRFLVQVHGSCLEVPEDGDCGEHFWPITYELVRKSDECDAPWSRCLYEILRGRLTNCYQSDAQGLISQSRIIAQPSGRYVNPADIIKRWNASLGRCQCGRHIWLAWEDPWDWLSEEEKNKRALGSACLQRINPTLLHLEHNVADTMICQYCSSATNYNPIQSQPSNTPT